MHEDGDDPGEDPPIRAARPGACWSIGSLAEEFEVDRRTAARLVRGMAPSGEWRGHPTYRLAEVAPAFVAFHANGGRRVRDAEVNDPDDMHPKDRSDWFASELKRLQVEGQLRRLVPTDAMRALLDEVLERLTSWAGTVAPQLERDAALNPEQTRSVVETSDRLLGDLRVQLIDDVRAAGDERDALD